MATEPTIRDLSLDEIEIAKREAKEQGLSTDQILRKQPEAAKGFGELKSRLPAPIEGGGEPVKVGEKTIEAIAKAPEGINPDLQKALEAVPTIQGRMDLLLNALEEGGVKGSQLDAVDMTDLVMFSETSEIKE
jgi:hypothetical protein